MGVARSRCCFSQNVSHGPAQQLAEDAEARAALMAEAETVRRALASHRERSGFKNDVRTFSDGNLSWGDSVDVENGAADASCICDEAVAAAVESASDDSLFMKKVVPLLSHGELSADAVDVEDGVADDSGILGEAAAAAASPSDDNLFTSDIRPPADSNLSREGFVDVEGSVADDSGLDSVAAAVAAESPSDGSEAPSHLSCVPGEWSCMFCTSVNALGCDRCSVCERKRIQPWDCSFCCFRNYREEDVCEICNCGRDREAKHWSCAGCSHGNVYATDVCVMCGTRPRWFRCYVAECGRRTLNPVRIRDADCPHVACCLEHSHRVEDAWWSIKQELLSMEADLPA